MVDLTALGDYQIINHAEEGVRVWTAGRPLDRLGMVVRNNRELESVPIAWEGMT